MDVRRIGVGVDDAGDAFERLRRPVERRHEQAAPARRRADRPVIVELAGRAGFLRIAGDLMGAVIAHHRPVELPAGIDGAAVILDLEADGRRERQDPAGRHRVEKRHAALDGQAVVGGRRLLRIDGRQLAEPVGQDGLGRHRRGDDAVVLRSAEKADRSVRCGKNETSVDLRRKIRGGTDASGRFIPGCSQRQSADACRMQACAFCRVAACNFLARLRTLD